MVNNAAILVGSRKLRINRRNSDYDILMVSYGKENRHSLKMGSFKNHNVDMHTYNFENKEKVIEYILRDCSSFSLASLIYPEFRAFWNITIEEALEIINHCERNIIILRNYEKAYFNYQLKKKKVNRRYLKKLYREYKASLKR